MDNIAKLKAISTPEGDDWLKIAEEWEQEDAYLNRSAKIAASVLAVLDQRHMTKQDLAKRMGVSAQYVSKIVRGYENLTLETISKLESALGVTLLNTVDYTVEQTSTIVQPITVVKRCPKVMFSTEFSLGSMNYSASFNNNSDRRSRVS